MRRPVLLALLLVLVGAAIWIWIELSPSPERRIRARLVELQDLVSFRASEGNLAVLAKLQRLGSLFAEDAQIRFDAPGAPPAMLTGRDSILQAAAGARQAAGDLTVEFKDVTVTISDDKRSAVVDAVGRAREKGGEGMWIQLLRFRFIETDEGWLISLVETVRVLTRADPGSDQVVQLPHGA